MADKVETQEAITHEDLVDAFKWDAGDDGIFTTTPVKDKTAEQQEVIDKAKGKEDAKKDKENGNGGSGREQQPEPESEHSWFESEGSENTEGKGTKGKTTKTAGAAESEDEPVDEPEGKTKVKVADENEDDPEKPDTFFKTLATELKEKGILSSIEITEDEEIDEDKFFELQNEEIEARADEIFNGIFEQLKQDPDAVAFLQFKRAGGSTYDFFHQYREATNLPDNMDLADATNQEKVLKYYYLNVEKVDEEDLAEKLEFVKEKGKTEFYAKKYYKEINDKDTAAKLALIQSQEEQVQKNKVNSEKLKTELQKILTDGTGEADFKFDVEDSKELVAYITKATIKIGTNRWVTAFQAKIGEIMNDRKKMLTLAKIVRKDFKIPNLKKEITNTVNKEVKSKLIEAKHGNKARSTTTNAEKSLADFFN